MPRCYRLNYLNLSLLSLPVPHPKYVAAGIYQCFCSGMGHLLLLVLPL